MSQVTLRRITAAPYPFQWYISMLFDVPRVFGHILRWLTRWSLVLKTSVKMTKKLNSLQLSDAIWHYIHVSWLTLV